MMASSSKRRSSHASPAVPNIDDGETKIECPVCFEIFKSPKCLSCGHSVCGDCCKILPLTNNSIMCPVCRDMTAMPDGGLRTNFALQDCLQLYQNLVQQDQKKKNNQNASVDCVAYKCGKCAHLCTPAEASLARVYLGADPFPYCHLCFKRTKDFVDSTKKPDTPSAKLPKLSSVVRAVNLSLNQLAEKERQGVKPIEDQRRVQDEGRKRNWNAQGRMNEEVSGKKRRYCNNCGEDHRSKNCQTGYDGAHDGRRKYEHDRYRGGQGGNRGNYGHGCGGNLQGGGYERGHAQEYAPNGGGDAHGNGQDIFGPLISGGFFSGGFVPGGFLQVGYGNGFMQSNLVMNSGPMQPMQRYF